MREALDAARERVRPLVEDALAGESPGQGLMEMRLRVSAMTITEGVTRAAQGGGEVVVAQAGGGRIIFSEGRGLNLDLPPIVEPPEYPDTPTKLKDKGDSWLK